MDADPRSASLTASVITQRSISPIRSKRSATGRNVFGAISVPSRPTIRNSSSWATVRRPGSAMIGWAWSTKRCSSSVSLIRPTHSNQFELAPAAFVLDLSQGDVGKDHLATPACSPAILPDPTPPPTSNRAPAPTARP